MRGSGHAAKTVSPFRLGSACRQSGSTELRWAARRRDRGLCSRSLAQHRGGSNDRHEHESRTRGTIMERYQLSKELAGEILAQAKRQGATAGDVGMVEGESLYVTVRLGEIDKISQSREKRLGLRLFRGTSSATASTSDISQAAIDKLIDDTLAMASATAP